MSGGAFDYAYAKVRSFADELELKIHKNNETDVYDEAPYGYRPDTLEALDCIREEALRVSQFMREAEWLYSGDIGEETFLKRIENIGP
jgi:hypothetical protein